mmetsp:Transcript_58469/g.124024  ORF Transcript_58469/g.124024 Transcript_58469/m.124024 type:complete len:215 (+) Transcript_58469:682-1326(+)
MARSSVARAPHQSLQFWSRSCHSRRWRKSSCHLGHNYCSARGFWRESSGPTADTMIAAALSSCIRCSFYPIKLKQCDPGVATSKTRIQACSLWRLLSKGSPSPVAAISEVAMCIERVASTSRRLEDEEVVGRDEHLRLHLEGHLGRGTSHLEDSSRRSGACIECSLQVVYSDPCQPPFLLALNDGGPLRLKAVARRGQLATHTVQYFVGLVVRN